MYRKNCEDPILGFPNLGLPNYTIDREKVLFASGNYGGRLIITDVSGKRYVDADISNTKTISFNFEKNIIYLLTLVSNQEIDTRKILFK